MRVIAISGTPGTGKTSNSKRLNLQLNSKLFSLSEIVNKKQFFTSRDEARETYVTDENRLINYLIKKIREYEKQPIDFMIIEGHFVDILPADLIDMAIILRCHPERLSERLSERGYNSKKIQENLQAEILGNSVSYMIETQGDFPILEIDTTLLSLKESTQLIHDLIIKNEDPEKYKIGRVDWLEELSKENKLEEYFD